MKPTLKLYLVRHSAPLIAAGTCYGQLDCLLSDDYEKQLTNISRYFNDADIHAIYSSPLFRCAQLATDLAKQHVDNTVIYYDAFKEINFGLWEGKKWDDIGREKIEQWNANRLLFQFPDGETPALFIQRVLKAYALLQTNNTAKQNKDKTIILITHAGVIRTILADILALSFSETLNLSIDKASISLISAKDNVQEVIFINHLPSKMANKKR